MKTRCGVVIPDDAERLTTNGADVHFGDDDEHGVCEICRGSTPTEWARFKAEQDDKILLWHAVFE